MKPFRYTLPAAERIKSRKLFDLLFETGNSLKQYPVKMVWREIPFYERNPVKMAVSVPKRNMADATDRNRMKRLVREAYRLNKQLICETALQRKKGLALLFIVPVNSPLSFAETQEKIILLLQRLCARYDQAAE